jgi:hypothetical protein
MRFPWLAAAAIITVPAPQYAPDRLPPDLRPAAERARQAIRAAACAAEERFGEGDPDATTARCEGAAEVPGDEVGRTSARLRNPRNAPPGWARAWVAATDGKKATAVAPVAFDLGDRIGLLEPIAIQQRCLGCHAARDAIEPDTLRWLAKAYPRDRSFGYSLGDLRGFWWAEAAKAP